ncbi:MlaD family protein [Patulibacter defluvii]|uniref:MlaD family protein n=1 Tax=Patulibacter defluvii TaxID=3095358 RepID=UPI002A74CC94|nr:MlaD family protein [Patulibacter sp. DM4]
MRRAGLLLAALLVAAVAALLLLRGGGEGEGDYRFDAIFDTAKGIVPGQLLKVGGVRAGRVEAVHLTPGHHARMSFSLDRRYAPLRQGARCRILPEGFISESFVDCDPGPRGQPPLRASGDAPPTVALERTQIPVALQDVVDLFAVPTADRIRVLLSELGLATAGRGRDLNAILRRANPALTDARSLLAVLDGQRTRLADAVAASDAVLARLAGSDRAIRRLVDRGAAATAVTAGRERALGEGVRRLPAMLAEADGGLDALDRTAVRLTPLVRDLRASAPSLRRLTTVLPRFARTGTPALRDLQRLARRGRPQLAALRPLARDVERLVGRLGAPLDRARRLLVDTRDRGGIDETLRLLYSLSTVTALRDDVSHIVSIFAGVYSQCLLNRSAPGCSHAYAAPGKGLVPVNDPASGPREATDRAAADPDPTVERLRRRLRELLR